MRIGIYFDLRNPAEWQRSPAALYADAIDLAVESERLGLDSVWASEHHFFDDGYLPQPFTLLAAIAARTTRVLLGTAIVVAPLHHPVDLAEQAALVDIISNGRLRVGLGAGYAKREFDAFGADLATRYGTTDSRIREIRTLLDDGGVTPSPIQRPFPIWAGYQGPQGARRAGRLGCGLLSLNAELLTPYRAGLVDGGYDPSSARMMGLLGVILADDPESTYERLLPYVCHQLNTYRAAAAVGSGRTPSLITPEKLREGRSKPGVIPPIEVLDPTDAVTRLRQLTDGVPAEEIYLWASIAGMPDDIVHRHIELLARIRPQFAG
ncbi:MAG TPA: LLM class flavin-dependent oxidoreductase [Acidimicrobiales bacterium]|nr:LLM class flavin-dependent oxidoreductase [Acidimicrobiales bacterium]